MKPDLFWIPGPWPGKLALVLRPRGGNWLADEVHAWREAGVDVAVSLLEPDEASDLGLDGEAEVANSKRIRFFSFPIPDRGIPTSTRDVSKFLETLAGELAAGKTVAVHCRQSVGRSGMIAAGLLVKSGMSADRAVEVVSAGRGETVPETPAQLRWIQDLATRGSFLAPR